MVQTLHEIRQLISKNKSHRVGDEILVCRSSNGYVKDGVQVMNPNEL